MLDKTTAGVTSLYSFPGHLVRRLQQINIGIFHELLSEYNVTPVQFGLLLRLTEVDRIDQRTLGEQIGVNAATVSDVTLRLEKRGLLKRQESPQDRRVKLLSITKPGREFMLKLVPIVSDGQKLLLEPLSDEEQKEFVRMASKVVEANNHYSRAPINLEREL